MGTRQKADDAVGEAPEEVTSALGRLEAARAELEAFRQDHAEVIERYTALTAERTAAYEELKALYAKHHAQIGPSYAGFTVIRKRSVDTELLLTLMPDAIALVKHTMPVKTLDELVLNGSVDQDVAERVTCISEVINGPKP